MYKIIPFLFLGNKNDAISVTSIDVDLVVNCTVDIPASTTLKTYRVAINDDDSDIITLFKLLPDAVDAIHTAITSNKKVLIHCKMGQQRSCTVIAAYLMFIHRDWTVENTISFIKTKKPDAFFWKANFYETLTLWRTKIHLHSK